MDTFSNEAVCEICGAPLNTDCLNESGQGSVVCSACGHENVFDAPAVDDDDAGSFLCPHCGAVLDFQYGFEPDDVEWVCRQCGKLISDTLYNCPHCGALLNDQCGFTPNSPDWSCTECGRPISESISKCPHCSAVLNDQENFDPNDPDFICAVCGMAVSQPDDAPAVTPKPAFKLFGYDPPEYVLHAAGREERLRMAYRIYAMLAAAVILIIISAAVSHRLNSMIPAGLNDRDLVGLNYNEAISILSQQGFTNVTAKACPDLDNVGNAADYTVKQVRIDGQSRFGYDDMFPDSSKTVVVFHSLKEISIPLSSYDASKLTYSQAEAAFRSAGFVNVSSQADNDLIFGWIHKQDQVEDILINSVSDFSGDEAFRPDAEIIIVYHSFPDKSRLSFPDANP